MCRISVEYSWSNFSVFIPCANFNWTIFDRFSIQRNLSFNSWISSSTTIVFSSIEFPTFPTNMTHVDMETSTIDQRTAQELKDIANKLRVHSIRSTSIANSGHPTSSCSAAEILSVLFFNAMKYDPNEPRDPKSDRFVMSKGHACPALYGAWLEAGHITAEELMTLRKIDSDLEGHPTPRLDFIDVGTGSLGQGLSCAAGMAYTAKYFDKASYKVFCLMGDGESCEGSVWEAMHFASYYKLDNLIAILDVNRLGQSEATSLGHQFDVYKQRFEAFGFETFVVDGHSVEELCRAFSACSSVKGKPCGIICKTFKGRGIVGVEDQDNFHGKPLGDKTDAAIQAILPLIKNNSKTFLTPKMPTADVPDLPKEYYKTIRLSQPPNYKTDDQVAPRLAYGTALIKLGQNCDRVISLDGDVKNSTYAEKFKKVFPDRFVECFIAEQNMVGVAIGCGTRLRTIPFCSTFATFFTRAYDQLRMGAVSMANIKCCGSHVGCSIGEDGPSQMGLEDIGMFRSLPGSTVFYPSDAVSMERAVELSAQIYGICFIRSTRAVMPILYPNDEIFEIGRGKMIRQSANDKILLVGAGITLLECIKAADELAKKGVHCAIMDPFTLKPIDKQLLVEQGKRVGGKIITVEDHYYEGGMGETICAALADQSDISIRCLAVPVLPRSGTPDGLMDLYGISARHIVEAVCDAQ